MESFSRKTTFLLLIIQTGNMPWLVLGVCHRLRSSKEMGEGKGAPRSWELKGLTQAQQRVAPLLRGQWSWELLPDWLNIKTTSLNKPCHTIDFFFFLNQ